MNLKDVVPEHAPGVSRSLNSALVSAPMLNRLIRDYPDMFSGRQSDVARGDPEVESTLPATEQAPTTERSTTLPGE